jgi:hypothetical protein
MGRDPDELTIELSSPPFDPERLLEVNIPPVHFALDLDLESALDWERGRSPLLVVGYGGGGAGGDDSVRSIGVEDSERFRLSGMRVTWLAR